MFHAKTNRISGLAILHHKPIDQLESLFVGKVNIYIDYANVRPWASKLMWNIDYRRLKQFLESFSSIKSINLYDGTLDDNKKSEDDSRLKFSVFKDGFKTKSVKIIKHSIDYKSIKPSSTDLLEQFIRKCLIRKYDLDVIEYLNYKFKNMNDRGEYFIEDRKCNFDVEIGVDMLMDFKLNNINTFVLWSGDSDFYNPVIKLLLEGKHVVLFATARKVSVELNSLKSEGLFIFDIQKIRNFICWKSQIKAE